MFKARFKKYWCDYCKEYTEKTFSSVEDILEYVYKVHKDSVYPAVSQFRCCGKWDFGNGFLSASYSLPERMGYRGDLELERIIYNGDTVIYERSKYISPKASEAFNEFAKIAKQRDENKNYGDY